MAKGIYECYKTAKGYYNFRLKASNKETLIVSGGTGYSSMSSLKAGIESIKKNIGAPIEDQTLKKTVELSNPKFEIYLDKAEQFRFRLRARNGELLCVSEDGYATKDGCKKCIANLAKWTQESDIVNVDK